GMRARTTLIAMAVSIALVGAAVGFWYVVEPDARFLAGDVRTSGKALVGGPFDLVDQTGTRRTDEEFRGRYMLIVFGYTYCPDICPAELQVVSAALDRLGASADRIQPFFITVDPERDTADQLAAYMQHFHPRFVGLTGTAEEIERVAKAYRVYYAKVDDDSAGDYLMDHSTIIYLMDGKGDFVTHFTYGITPEKLAAELAAFVG